MTQLCSHCFVFTLNLIFFSSVSCFWLYSGPSKVWVRLYSSKRKIIVDGHVNKKVFQTTESIHTQPERWTQSLNSLRKKMTEDTLSELVKGTPSISFHDEATCSRLVSFRHTDDTLDLHNSSTSFMFVNHPSSLGRHDEQPTTASFGILTGGPAWYSSLFERLPWLDLPGFEST